MAHSACREAWKGLSKVKKVTALHCGAARVRHSSVTFNPASLRSGSSTHSMGVYYRGYGAAFCTQMKLFHVGRESFLPAEAWPAVSKPSPSP